MVVLDAVGAILACAALLADRGSTFSPTVADDLLC
jgi:hypothetical protein